MLSMFCIGKSVRLEGQCNVASRVGADDDNGTGALTLTHITEAHRSSHEAPAAEPFRGFSVVIKKGL